MLNFLILFNPRLHPLPGEIVVGGEDETMGAVLAVLFEFFVLECGKAHHVLAITSARLATGAR